MRHRFGMNKQFSYRVITCFVIFEDMEFALHNPKMIKKIVAKVITAAILPKLSKSILFYVSWILFRKAVPLMKNAVYNLFWSNTSAFDSSMFV